MDALERSAGVSNPLGLLQSMIERGVDPGALEKMMDLSERWERNQAAKAFGEAITLFQSKMPVITKGNPVKDRSGKLMYCFADFDDIMAVAQPLLTECGITVTFNTEIVGALLKTTCHVRVGTHVEDTSIPLGLPAIPNANDSQRAGGAMRYGMRYSLVAALNIRIKGEDNDALALSMVGPEECEVLNGLLAQCRDSGNEVNGKAFWAYLGVEGMHDLPKSKFELARFELQRKLKAGKK